MESFGFLDLRFYIYRCRTPPLPCTRSYSLLTIILYPRWKRAVKLRFAPFQSNPSFIVEAQLRCVIEARSENLLWRLTLSPKITRWALVLRLRWETVESASVDACASVYVLLLRSRRRSISIRIDERHCRWRIHYFSEIHLYQAEAASIYRYLRWDAQKLINLCKSLYLKT